MRKFIDLAEEALSTDFSPAFWAWFADSTVVDGQGKPLVLYHGTAEDFESFHGMVWGSLNPDLAHDYATFRGAYGNNIIPIYMRIIKPFDADLDIGDPVTVQQFFSSAIGQSGMGGDAVFREKVREIMDQVRACGRREESGPHYERYNFWAEPDNFFGRDGANLIWTFFQMCGFDGIKLIENGHLTFGAFSSKQVKSVFNNGTFDPNSDRISESRLNEIQLIGDIENEVNDQRLSNQKELARQAPSIGHLSNGIRVLIQRMEDNVAVIYLTDQGGELVGRARLDPFRHGKDFHKIGHIWIKPEYRGRNIGFELYQFLLDRLKLKLVSDWDQTRLAKALWAKLAKAGYVHQFFKDNETVPAMIGQIVRDVEPHYDNYDLLVAVPRAGVSS